MTKPLLLTTTLAVAAAAALPAAANAQSDTPYTGGRPHATVTLRTAEGIAAERLQAAVRVSGRRAVVDVTVAGRAADGGLRQGRLSVSRCADDRRVVLRCPVAATTHVALGERTRRVRFRIAQPKTGGAVQVTLSSPASTSRLLTRLPASLTLPDEAWRGETAGDTFGAWTARTAQVTVPTLRFDAVGISDVYVRPTIRWTALSTVATSLRWQCVGAPNCDGSIRDQPLPAGKAITEQRRPGLRGAPSVIGATGSVGETEVLHVDLPRPQR